uniref:Uncharacterized protein n=1 Tax=Pygocentrus nattereri TaxID=42514 RepID=A0AAR2JMU1_PYGNA
PIGTQTKYKNMKRSRTTVCSLLLFTESLPVWTVCEKECILFFEETIDSLDDGLEEDGTGPAPIKPTAPSLIEHDIIDLVHSTPDFPMQFPGLKSFGTPALCV